MDTLRLRVLKALTSAIEDGNDAVLKDKVFRGRTVYGETDPTPMVSILEAPIPLDAVKSSNGNPNQTGPWELLIQGWAEDDRKNPTDPVHRLMGEVKKTLVEQRRLQDGFGILGMGKFVTKLQVGQGSCRPADEVSSRAYFWLIVTLTICEKLDDPFA